MVMEILKPYFVIEDEVQGEEILKKLETYARTCYKSEDKITADSAGPLIKKLIQRGHESILEHEKITVRVICDRGVSHEIVRHRIGSYTQESTRYCNYQSRGIKVIKPFFFDREKYRLWEETMATCESAYNKLIELGASPQEARSVLPNSLKTEIVITYNLREWRHFFKMRCSKKAHPQMRQVAGPLLREFKKLVPIIFDDISEE